MGSRRMSKWILFPLLDIVAIKKRQSFVDSFTKDNDLRQSISETLKDISDIERIASKIALSRVSPRELNALKNSLILVEEIKLQIKHSTSKNLKKWSTQLVNYKDIILQIERSLDENAPVFLAAGRVIKKGYDLSLIHI